MYSKFIVVLVAIIALVSNAAELKNSKTTLRTQAAKTSAMIYYCTNNAVSATSGFLLDTCMYGPVAGGSQKVIATSSTTTTVSYYAGTSCGGTAQSSIPFTVASSCDSQLVGYSTQGSDTSLTLPGYSTSATYYTEASCGGDLAGYAGFVIGSADDDSCVDVTVCTSNIGSQTVCDPDSSCFAGSETVTMESGDMKMISDVIVGDRVLASDVNGKTSFSDVISVPHARNNIETSFTQIFTSSGNDIKMTANHLLPSGVCGGDSFSLIKASNVEVGSCIQSIKGQEQVTSTKVVSGKGIYTIVTNEEYVVVNGIIASPFAGNHALGNAYYNIYRSLYSIAPTLFASSWFTKAHTAFSDFLMTVSP